MRSLSVATMRRISGAGALRSRAGNAIHVVGRDPQAARTAEDVAVLLAGAAHGRRVDDGQQFHEVFDQQAVEERLVAVLQRRPGRCTSPGRRLGAQVFQLHGDLLFDRADLGGMRPSRPSRCAFFVRKGRALVVERGRVESCGPPTGGFPREVIKGCIGASGIEARATEDFFRRWPKRVRWRCHPIRGQLPRLAFISPLLS